MRTRDIVLVSIFLFTVLLGGLISFDEAGRGAGTGFQWGLAQDYLSSAWNGFSQWAAVIINKLVVLSRTLGSRDLLFFGGMTVFGTAMLGLVLRNATKTPGDKIESLLKALVEEKEKAENLVQLKSEFLNQISHELRTPLAVIMGYLECIMDGLYGQVETKHREILKAVSKQSNDLKNMIDQILVFSRLEAGKDKIRLEEFPISKIVNDLKDTYEFLGRQKGLEVKWDLAAGIPPVNSDPDRIKEILSNLLQNAVKYTDKGSIFIRIQYATSTDSVTLEVNDTGVGIPNRCLATIFDPFVQVHKTSSENSRGGIGLGLSIVKRHVEQLRGTINVQSEMGKGTTFIVILPRTYITQQNSPGQLFTWVKRLGNNTSKPLPKANEVAATMSIGGPQVQDFESTAGQLKNAGNADMVRPH
jgi:signal transduction histidine kinase